MEGLFLLGLKYYTKGFSFNNSPLRQLEGAILTAH